jgi:hypothetical protein
MKITFCKKSNLKFYKKFEDKVYQVKVIVKVQSKLNKKMII